MKDLSHAALVGALKVRLALLRPESERIWGTMTAAQALAHSAAGFEVALGERKPPRLLLGSMIGWVIKPLVFGSDAPMRRNTPTMEGLVVADERVLGHERERLIALIDRFIAAGASGCTTHPHSYFGRLTYAQWSMLMYKHLDHHLRQFRV
jgi:hypothetical protein